VNAGELSARSWADYKEVCVLLVSHLGKARLVSDLVSEDFSSLRTKMAKRWGPYHLAKAIQCARSTFKYAFDADLIDRPVRFGPGFARPTKKTLRLHRRPGGRSCSRRPRSGPWSAAPWSSARTAPSWCSPARSSGP
jgi:hypothetical protein